MSARADDEQEGMCAVLAKRAPNGAATDLRGGAGGRTQREHLALGVATIRHSSGANQQGAGTTGSRLHAKNAPSGDNCGGASVS
jgi:hypothetical protein